MHGSWGSLTMLIKRQQATKNRKEILKHDLQKRIKGLLDNKSVSNLEFPEISKQEMKVLKAKIRAEHKKETIKNLIISLLIILSVALVFVYIIFFNK